MRFATLFKNGRGCSKAKKATRSNMAVKTMDEWDAILAAESSDDHYDAARELAEMLANCVCVQERMTKLKTLITEVSKSASKLDQMPE